MMYQLTEYGTDSTNSGERTNLHNHEKKHDKCQHPQIKDLKMESQPTLNPKVKCSHNDEDVWIDFQSQTFCSGTLWTN